MIGSGVTLDVKGARDHGLLHQQENIYRVYGGTMDEIRIDVCGSVGFGLFHVT